MDFLLATPEIFLAHKQDKKRGKKDIIEGAERRGEKEESTGMEKEGEMARTILLQKLLKQLNHYSYF